MNRNAQGVLPWERQHAMPIPSCGLFPPRQDTPCPAQGGLIWPHCTSETARSWQPVAVVPGSLPPAGSQGVRRGQALRPHQVGSGATPLDWARLPRLGLAPRRSNA